MTEQIKQGQDKLTVKTDTAVVSSGEAVIVCPCGRVDGSTADILDGAIRAQLEVGAGVLIFNFEELDYISSAGLRVLLLSARNMQSSGGKALFCGLAPHIAQIFEISGFGSILDIRENLADALAAV